ncbi:MAG: hypothetical protein H6Q69_4619, partial [Firmicutes bacterium]|nr:hypothetical protein [Bacillota bacterium]
VMDFFTEKDKQQGYLVAKNRHGIVEKFPLTTLSICVVQKGTKNQNCI